MSTIKIILKKDVHNLGEEGDVKTVRRGYARNFLLPNDMIMEYSKQNRKTLETKKEYFEKKKLEKKQNAEQLKEKLEKEKLSATVSAGEKGRLFGTVTSADIAVKLNELQYNIERKNIELKEHIKFSGTYKFRIHIYQTVYANMEIEVIGKVEKPKAPEKKARKSRRNYSEDIENTESNETAEQPEAQAEKIEPAENKE